MFKTDLKTFQSGRRGFSGVRNRLALCSLVAALAVLTTAPAAAQAARNSAATTTADSVTPNQLRQFTIRDRANGVEWLRCSVGQVWNGLTCMGEPRMLTLEEARSAAAMARVELGGEWRLPTLQELEKLVCKDCEPPKIDTRLFPRTWAAPYWTDSINRWSVGRYWTVNFFTGYTFGRNMPSMVRYVRLVRDFPPAGGVRD